MSIDLTELERGQPFAGDYPTALTALQERLARLQMAQIVHKKQVMVLFEGWVGAGKKAALKRLVASWDPCFTATHCVGAEDSDRHWLAPYWSRLPPAGHTTIFYRCWYRQLADRRARGLINDKEWARATDEINEFEAQQRDHGTLIVKLFFHISERTQAARLRDRIDDPWRRRLIDPAELRNMPPFEATREAWTELFGLTDTRWAPWLAIDANDKRATRIAALSAIADALEKALPVAPPVEDGNIVSLYQSQRYG